MAVLDNTQALVDDALFRSGEIPGASEWDAKAVDYINRAHRAICSGAFEFLPEFVTDWWWMRANGLLTLLPIFNTGTAAVTQDNTGITFSVAPTFDPTGRRFKVDGWGETYVVASGAAGNPNAVLDSPFNGVTNPAALFKLMKTNYTLAANIAAIMSPVTSFKDNPRLYGVSPERLDELFPLPNLQAGIPYAFALESPSEIRFSHGGRSDGISVRMEYRYRPTVVDLTYSPTSFPLIPIDHRHVLSDVVTFYLMTDKNDDRAVTIGTSARSTLGAMTKDNTKRMQKMDQFAGMIVPRQSAWRNRRWGPLRTESGMIIG